MMNPILLIGSAMTEILIVFLTLIIGAIIYYKHKLSYWKRKNVMQIEPSIPFGNMTPLIFMRKSIGQAMQSFYQQFRAKQAKFGGIYFVCEPVLLINDPDLIKLVLTKDFSHFHDRSFVINEADDPVSKNIASEHGKQWRILRTKLSPTFTSGKLKIMFETFVLCSKQLIYTIDKDIETNPVIDIRDLIGRFSTDIISSTAFGLECSSLKNPNTEFRAYGKLIFASETRLGLGRTFGLVNDNIVKYFKLQQFDPKATEFFTDAIKQTIEYRERNKIVRNDLLNMLLRLKNNQSIDDDNDNDNDNDNEDMKYKLKDEEKVLTVNEIIAQAILFIFAGHETTSSSTTLCLFELAQQQELQDRLRNEIEHVLEQYSGQVTYEALANMKYLTKVVNETLRKYPIGTILMRKCVETYQVPNEDLVIEKGTNIFISLTGLHNDPEYYPDPTKFDPERFSEEEIAKRHPYTYLPFGEGPRNCIGMRFALVQIKLVLTMLLLNYKFTLDPSTKVPFQPDTNIGILYCPKNKILLRTEKISSRN